MLFVDAQMRLCAICLPGDAAGRGSENGFQSKNTKEIWSTADKAAKDKNQGKGPDKSPA